MKFLKDIVLNAKIQSLLTIKRNYSLNDGIRFVLVSMCSAVGAPFHKIDFFNGTWYHEYSWTEEEEKEWKEMIVDIIYNDKKVRTSLKMNGWSKKKIKENIDWFAGNYGWKTYFG